MSGWHLVAELARRVLEYAERQRDGQDRPIVDLVKDAWAPSRPIATVTRIERYRERMRRRA